MQHRLYCAFLFIIYYTNQHFWQNSAIQVHFTWEKKYKYLHLPYALLCCVLKFSIGHICGLWSHLENTDVAQKCHYSQGSMKTDHSQIWLFVVSSVYSFQKFQFIHNLLINPVNRQTDKSTRKASFKVAPTTFNLFPEFKFLAHLWFTIHICFSTTVGYHTPSRHWAHFHPLTLNFDLHPGFVQTLKCFFSRTCKDQIPGFSGTQKSLFQDFPLLQDIFHSQTWVAWGRKSAYTKSVISVSGLQ